MRRRAMPIIVLTIVVFALLRFVPVWGQASPPLVGYTTNLLTNPGFEGAFTMRPDPNYGGPVVPELGVAEGWELWYDKDHRCPPYNPGCDPNSYYLRPEYKGEEYTARVRSGGKAQKFFNNYGTHWAGFYQVAEVPPQSWVRFSIWVWTWSSELDIPEYSFRTGDYRVYVGIDPTGGTDWASEAIQWSPSTTRPDRWVQLEVAAYTESGHVSVWTRGAPVWPVKHNDSYWDDAELVVLGGTPTPTPTPTSTQTPCPVPQATPTGYAPPACGAGWHPIVSQNFDDGQAPMWSQDAALGSVGVVSETLWLRNGPNPARTAPLAWLTRPWPADRDLRVSFSFAFPSLTGYGTGVMLGSQPFDGERWLIGSSPALGEDELLDPRRDPARLDIAPMDWTATDERAWMALLRASSLGDILEIHHNAVEFTIKLFGETIWTGAPGDVGWHTLQLELRESTYIVSVDGTERGRALSCLRPQSLVLGNTVVVPDPGGWTEIRLDDLRIEQCGAGSLFLPLLLRSYALPQPTVPPAPTTTRPAG